MKIHYILAAALLLLGTTSSMPASVKNSGGLADTAGTKYPRRSFLKDEPIPPYSLGDLDYMISKGEASTLLLGKTKQQRPIEAWYFPGSSQQRALIIGGMHGSELSSIEVSRMVIDLLTAAEQPFYSVIIIPSLFPDNAAKAIAQPSHIGDITNTGRYSSSNATDPNRQMPSPGTWMNEEDARDHAGRAIEKENQVLLSLIAAFRPTRIANVHAIRDTLYGGVYADPRTDETGRALGYDSDSTLAITLATAIDSAGGNIAGNHLHKKPTALYYKDPKPVAAGELQPRNMAGSRLNAHRGSGVSMGTWGSTAIADCGNDKPGRPAMRVITIEFPGAKRPQDYSIAQRRQFWEQQVRVFAGAIRDIFLGEMVPE